jgi:hypothetical protein
MGKELSQAEGGGAIMLVLGDSQGHPEPGWEGKLSRHLLSWIRSLPGSPLPCAPSSDSQSWAGEWYLPGRNFEKWEE